MGHHTDHLQSKSAVWACGFGVIQHSHATQAGIHSLFARYDTAEADAIVDLLIAADRVASAAMWLVVHETYARRVYLDGWDLLQDDFKSNPQGTPAVH